MKKSFLILFISLISNLSFAQSNCNVDVVNNLSLNSPAIDEIIKTSLKKNDLVMASRENSDSVLEVSEVDTMLGLTTVVVSVKLKNLKNEHREITTTGTASSNIFLAMINPDSEKLRVTKAAVKNAMENISKSVRNKCK